MWFAPAKAALERWQAMRELRKLERDSGQDSYWSFKNLIVEANEVLERDQRGRAVAIWTEAFARFPNEAIKSEAASGLLLRLGLYDEAESVLRKGQKQYPNDPFFPEGLAQVAYQRGDREEALRRCEILRKQRPSSVKGYWIAAAALSELGRAEDAEAILARGQRLVPDNIALRMEYARLADRRRDWPESLTRWNDIYETFGNLAGICGAATALKELGREDEAEQLLSSVLYKAGAVAGIFIGLASIAEHRQDWEEAVRRWAATRDRFPLQTQGYFGAVQPLLKLGREAAAETVLLEGIERIPADPLLLIEYALLAHRRGDWAEAVPRWAMLRERLPGRSEGYRFGSDALKALGRTAEAAELVALTPTK